MVRVHADPQQRPVMTKEAAAAMNADAARDQVSDLTSQKVTDSARSVAHGHHGATDAVSDEGAEGSKIMDASQPAEQVCMMVSSLPCLCSLECGPSTVCLCPMPYSGPTTSRPYTMFHMSGMNE